MAELMVVLVTVLGGVAVKPSESSGASVV